MGPNGSENFKTLLLLQITANSFEACPKFSSNGLHKSTCGIFEMLSFRFLTFFFFFRKFQIHHCGLWRNQKPQLSGKRTDCRANGSEIWDS